MFLLFWQALKAHLLRHRLLILSLKQHKGSRIIITCTLYDNFEVNTTVVPVGSSSTSPNDQPDPLASRIILSDPAEPFKLTAGLATLPPPTSAKVPPDEKYARLVFDVWKNIPPDSLLEINRLSSLSSPITEPSPLVDPVVLFVNCIKELLDESSWRCNFLTGSIVPN